MILSLLLLGYDSRFKTNDSFWDKAEIIPDARIIQREIESAVNGKPFFIIDEKGKPVRLEAVQYEDFQYYYELWEDFHYLKILAHGQGTLAERRWYLNLLKAFEKTFNMVEAMLMNRKFNG